MSSNKYVLNIKNIHFNLFETKTSLKLQEILRFDNDNDNELKELFDELVKIKKLNPSCKAISLMIMSPFTKNRVVQFHLATNSEKEQKIQFKFLLPLNKFIVHNNNEAFDMDYLPYNNDNNNPFEYGITWFITEPYPVVNILTPHAYWERNFAIMHSEVEDIINRDITGGVEQLFKPFNKPMYIEFRHGKYNCFSSNAYLLELEKQPLVEILPLTQFYSEAILNWINEPELMFLAFKKLSESLTI